MSFMIPKPKDLFEAQKWYTKKLNAVAAMETACRKVHQRIGNLLFDEGKNWEEILEIIKKEFGKNAL